MAVWGISCNLQRGVPIVVGLEVVGPRRSPQAREVVRHRCDPNESWSLQLKDMTADIETQLRQSSPTAVVVRSMDHSPFGRSEATSRIKYQVEGAVLAAARRHCEVVESKNGQEIGRTCDSNKNGVEQEAEQAFGSGYVEAGAAGLAALVIANEA